MIQAQFWEEEGEIVFSHVVERLLSHVSVRKPSKNSAPKPGCVSWLVETSLCQDGDVS